WRCSERWVIAKSPNRPHYQASRLLQLYRPKAKEWTQALAGFNPCRSLHQFGQGCRMQIFLSAGEPSGDVHGANLVRQLHRLHPSIECVGFGGKGMEAAGCELLYPLSGLAVMGLTRVLTQVPVFLSLIARADRFLARRRPDAVVLIDFPGL